MTEDPNQSMGRLVQRTQGTAVARRYRRRWQWELDRVREKGWSGRILQVARQVKDVRGRGVRVGPARGGGESCLLLYALGANLLDPVQFEISAERFYSRSQWVPVTYFASDGHGPVFYRHPALAGSTENPDSWSHSGGDLAFTNWCSFDEVLNQLKGDGLEVWATAFALARPGPAGSGLFTAYMNDPVTHRWALYREKPTDQRLVTPWQRYEMHRGHALAEAYLLAVQRGYMPIIKEVQESLPLR